MPYHTTNGEDATLALTLEVTKEISRELLAVIVEMDHAAYPPEDQMTWDRAEMIYTYLQDSLILLREDGRLIGFLSIYAVSSELVPLAVRRQCPIFLAEEKHQLMQCVTPPVEGYLHNIIMHPDLRGRGYRRYLFLGLRHWLNSRPGISHIWADAVSEHGQRALAAIGLVPYPELKGLWGGSMQSVLQALDGKLSGWDWEKDVTIL